MATKKMTKMDQEVVKSNESVKEESHKGLGSMKVHRTFLSVTLHLGNYKEEERRERYRIKSGNNN